MKMKSLINFFRGLFSLLETTNVSFYTNNNKFVFRIFDGFETNKVFFKIKNKKNFSISVHGSFLKNYKIKYHERDS